MAELIDDIALLIQRGGYIMVPMLIMSIVSFMLIMERIWFWLSINRSTSAAQLAQLNDAMRTNNRKKAQRIVDSDRSPYAKVGRRLLDIGSSDGVALEAVEMQRPSLDRFMVMLSTIITAAPLLGILGTVIGIIQSFNLLGGQDTLTDPRVVSAGIAEALLTTALGLVIALFTLFPYSLFRNNVSQAMGKMESVIAAAQEGLKKPATAEAAKDTGTERFAQAPAAAAST
jgi:biopolymer transport protein ExbB